MKQPFNTEIYLDNKYYISLCRYRKRTDIYYSTWNFENVAKNSQFQFLDPPPNIAASFRIASFSF